VGSVKGSSTALIPESAEILEAGAAGSEELGMEVLRGLGSSPRMPMFCLSEIDLRLTRAAFSLSWLYLFWYSMSVG
jgi:hypothetical protein